MELAKLPLRRRISERVARVLLLGSALSAVAMLGWLLARSALAGFEYLDWGFLTSFTSRRPEDAGIKASLVGSLWLGGLTILFALPVGIGAGIYLNEYARPTRLTALLRTAVGNLAGVPSIVFGLLGLAVFVRLLGLGYILLAGALTLALLSLPMIIVATEESLKAVPRAIREAAYGVGASRWQVVSHHVLPYATPGIMTGSILALARAVGETAPLILVGGATAVFFLPQGPMDIYSALPLQAFNWAANQQHQFRALAASATLVLLALILLLNLAAILARNHFRRKIQW